MIGDTLSDRILMRQGEIFSFPMDLSRRLPNATLRFIGLFIAFPFTLILMILTFPMTLACFFVGLWEWSKTSDKDDTET
jgi:hypothetical protein